jgi:ribosomal protein S18 acetylase RimI-like enzyme
MATIEIDMHVSDATESDVEAVREVARASWETDYPDILSRESVEEGFDEWYGPDRLRENVEEPRSELLVAEADGSVVGFAHAFVDPEAVTLLRLYVHSDSRGEGVGRDLFEALVDRATEAGADRLRATALAANDPGAAFYRAMGLERVATDETTVAGERYPEHTFLLELE